MVKKIIALAKGIKPTTPLRIGAWALFLKPILQWIINAINNLSNLDFTIQAPENPRMKALWEFLISPTGNFVSVVVGLLWLTYFIWRQGQKTALSQAPETAKSQQWHETPENDLVANESPKVERPVTLQQLAKKDFGTCLIQSSSLETSLTIKETGETIPFQIDAHIMLDFRATAEFLVFYIPPTPPAPEPLTKQLCLALANEYKTALEIKKGVKVEGGMGGERSNTKDFQFTKRVYIYHETPMLKDECEEVVRAFKKKKLSVVLRSTDYVFDRNYKSYTWPKVANPE